VSGRESRWLRLALLALRLAAPLVPRDERPRWRAQWQADLTHQWRTLERAGRATPAAGRDLAFRSTGAWAHAWWLGFRNWRLEMLVADLRYALRLLARRPLFTALATLTLGIGIAANAVIFSWVDGLLLNPLGGVRDQRSLATLTVTTATRNGLSFSYPNFLDLRQARGGAFQDVAVFGTSAMSIRTDAGAERVWGQLFAGNMFDLLGVQPAAGRLLSEADNQAPGAHPVVVISHGFWTRRFGASPGAVGQTLVLNGRSFTIVGITPPAFKGTQAALAFDVFVPVMMESAFFPGNRLNERSNGWLQAYARLNHGRTLGELQAELDVVAARLAANYPETNSDRGLRAFELWRSPNGGQNILLPAFAVLAGIVGILLFLVCANLAGLLMARAAGRARELALRHALGASRFRLVQQLMIESLLLALIGGAAGIAAASWSGSLLQAFMPPLPIPIEIAAGLSWRVAFFTFLVSLAAGLALGILPAWQSSRASVRDTLQEGSGASVTWRKGRLRQGLVVTQVAVSLVLLVSAGLFVRSMGEARRLDPGFAARDGVVGAVDLQSAGYDEARGRQAHTALLRELRAAPGVEAAALARRMPLTATDSSDRTIEVEGYVPAPREEMNVFYNQVSDGFFEALQIPIVEGRSFTERDLPTTPRVVVISERMAKRFWPGRSAIGGRVKVGGEWATVAGVARDGKYGSMTEEPRPFMYLPLSQFYRPDVRIITRTAGASGQAVPAVRAAVARVDPVLPLFDMTTIAEHMAFSFFLFELLATLLGVFGVVAMLLASLGLYGVMALSVSQRTRELGVRLSLGATARDVLTLVMRQGFALVGIGLVAGVALSIGVAKLLASQLVGVSPFDASTYGATIAMVTVTAALACALPGWRAMRLDPLVALRQD
jgi:predicted permease